jgi:hypothetical protein
MIKVVNEKLKRRGTGTLSNLRAISKATVVGEEQKSLCN